MISHIHIALLSNATLIVQSITIIRFFTGHTPSMVKVIIHY